MDEFPPFCLSEPFQSAIADGVLEGAVAVGAIGRLHRGDGFFRGHRAAESRPRPRNSILPPRQPSMACTAASESSLTGRPNAFSKSAPIRPGPRLRDSDAARPFRSGPAEPMETAAMQVANACCRLWRRDERQVRRTRDRFRLTIMVTGVRNIGAQWDLRKWAMQDSNLRHLPCKGSALAN